MYLDAFVIWANGFVTSSINQKKTAKKTNLHCFSNKILCRIKNHIQFLPSINDDDYPLLNNKIATCPK